MSKIVVIVLRQECRISYNGVRKKEHPIMDAPL